MLGYFVDLSPLDIQERIEVEKRLVSNCWEVHPDYYTWRFKIFVEDSVDPRTRCSIPAACPITLSPPL